MPRSEFYIVAVVWAALMVFLTLFWGFTLQKLGEILRQRDPEVPAGLVGTLGYLLKGRFKLRGDERLEGLCKRLQKLLYGYLGAFAAFFVFLVIFSARR